MTAAIPVWSVSLQAVQTDRSRQHTRKQLSVPIKSFFVSQVLEFRPCYARLKLTPHQNYGAFAKSQVMAKIQTQTENLIVKMNSFLRTVILLLGLVVTGSLNAAPSGNAICKKMISDGRGGGMSQADCLCTYRVADAVLDEDIKSLLFESWYNGTNNMKAIEKLPRRNRIKKQFRTMDKTLKKNCAWHR
ncbi:MAG: hypothetical protein AAF496_16705 [Pseudomonadota bacterium]